VYAYSLNGIAKKWVSNVALKPGRKIWLNEDER
jgi:hypothetical protein